MCYFPSQKKKKKTMSKIKISKPTVSYFDNSLLEDYFLNSPFVLTGTLAIIGAS